MYCIIKGIFHVESGKEVDEKKNSVFVPKINILIPKQNQSFANPPLSARERIKPTLTSPNDRNAIARKDSKKVIQKVQKKPDEKQKKVE